MMNKVLLDYATDSMTYTVTPTNPPAGRRRERGFWHFGAIRKLLFGYQTIAPLPQICRGLQICLFIDRVTGDEQIPIDIGTSQLVPSYRETNKIYHPVSLRF